MAPCFLIFQTPPLRPSNRCHRVVLAACSSYLKTVIETSPEDDVTLLLDDTSNHQMEHLISFIYTGTASVACRSDYCSLVTMLQTLGARVNPGKEWEKDEIDNGDEEEEEEEEKDLVAPTSSPHSRTKLPSPSSSSSSTRELAPVEPPTVVADATASADEEDLMLLCGSEGVRGGNGAADDDLSLRTLLPRLQQQQHTPNAKDHEQQPGERHSHNTHKNADVNAAVDEQEDEHEEEEEELEEKNGQSNLLLSASFWPSCNESWCPPPPPTPPGRTDLFGEQREEQSHSPRPNRLRRSRRCRGDHEGNEDAEHVQSSFSTVDKSAILYCNITAAVAAAADDEGDATISVSSYAAADGEGGGCGGGEDNGSLMQSEGQTAPSSSSSSFSPPSPSSIGSSGVDENLPPASGLELLFNGRLDQQGDASSEDGGRTHRPEIFADVARVEGKSEGGKDRKRRRQRQRRRSGGESAHRCRHCWKRFASRHYLRFHEDSVHTKTKTISCGECSRKFTSVYYLKQHTVRMHSETRPFAW